MYLTSLWNNFVFDFTLPETPIMHGIIGLHDYIMFFLVTILAFVVHMLILILTFFSSKNAYIYKKKFTGPDLFVQNTTRRFLEIWYRLKDFVNSFTRFSAIFSHMPTNQEWVYMRRMEYQDYYHKYLKPFYTDYVTNKYYRINHSLSLEVIWTIIPTIILVLIAIPSFALLYAMDEMVDPSVTVKVIGHQWYWSYEYSDYGYLVFNYFQHLVEEADSNLLSLKNLEEVFISVSHGYNYWEY